MSNSENNHPHDTQGINTLKRDSVIRLVDDDPSVLRALTTFEGEENFVGDSEIIALGGASNETKDRPLG